MTRLEIRKIIFDFVRDADDFERARPQRIEIVIANCDEEQNARESGESQDSDKRGCEEFPVKTTFRCEPVAEAFHGGELVGDEISALLDSIGLREPTAADPYPDDMPEVPDQRIDLSALQGTA